MHIDPLEMTVQRQDRSEQRSFDTASVAGARFSSRDVAGMRRRMDEKLARAGRFTGATKANPSVYRIARYLLTQGPVFEVQGPLTGGEAEVVMIRTAEEIFISVGSDQCDRELDPIFPDKPKQLCPHPVATTAWPYGEVRDHWDSLQLQSRVTVGDQTVTLQDGDLSANVDLEFILAMSTVSELANPLVFFCGSTPLGAAAIAEIERLGLPEWTSHGIGDEYFCRLHDPVLDRTIEHTYRAIPLGDDLDDRRGPDGPAIYDPNE